MDEQIDVIILRCKECRRLRPKETPTAIGRLLRSPGSRWEADLWEHVPYVRQAWRVGVNDLSGDDHYGLAGDDERLEFLSLVPVRLSKDIRVDRLSCRGNCGRPPFTVRRAQVGGRAAAEGRIEVDV